jgi:hypothetical protein
VQGPAVAVGVKVDVGAGVNKAGTGVVVARSCVGGREVGGRNGAGVDRGAHAAVKKRIVSRIGPRPGKKRCFVIRKWTRGSVSIYFTLCFLFVSARGFSDFRTHVERQDDFACH